MTTMSKLTEQLAEVAGFGDRFAERGFVPRFGCEEGRGYRQ